MKIEAFKKEQIIQNNQNLKNYLLNECKKMFHENPCVNNELFRKKAEIILAILNDRKHGNEKIKLKRWSRKMP